MKRKRETEHRGEKVTRSGVQSEVDRATQREREKLGTKCLGFIDLRKMRVGKGLLITLLTQYLHRPSRRKT